MGRWLEMGRWKGRTGSSVRGRGRAGFRGVQRPVDVRVLAAARDQAAHGELRALRLERPLLWDRRARHYRHGTKNQEGAGGPRPPP